MLSNRKRVLVSVPNTGWIHKHVVFTLLKLQKEKRHDLKIILPTHRPLENNLHHIIKDFIEGEYDFWLEIDSDNPPINNPIDLVDYDRDIIGLPTPIIHFDKNKLGEQPVYWGAYDYVKEKDAYRPHREMEGLQRVDAISSGCFLISKRVFMNKEMRKGVFTRTLYEDGRVDKGTDISFCERARKQGFEIYTHYGYPCRHFNEIEINEMVEQFREFHKNN